MQEDSELILSDSFDNEAQVSPPKTLSGCKFVKFILGNICKPYGEREYSKDGSLEQSFTDLMSLNCPAKIQPLSIVSKNLIKRCKELDGKANIEVIDKLIYNDRAHIVSVFNECRAYSNDQEFLIKYACVQESLFFLPRVLYRPTIYRPFRFHWKEYCFLKRNNDSKERAHRMLNEKNNKKSCNSNLFDTTYRNRLVEDDLSNSLSMIIGKTKEVEEAGLLKLLLQLNDDETPSNMPSTRAPKQVEPKRNGSLGHSERTATDSRTEFKVSIETGTKDASKVRAVRVSKRPLLPPNKSGRATVNVPASKLAEVKLLKIDPLEVVLKTVPSSSRHNSSKWISPPKGDARKSKRRPSQIIIPKD
eukprot:TRINITY_DN6134_c0_g1_i4.p1 TRINITY_DN6134_c0_g1~~TRINITY_DN6134_c0_g1_i4.p1  ORF type:complete len:361 (+),score=74.37 TRINITY_DN6134_c0_g1_i4:160-1242(+)